MKQFSIIFNQQQGSVLIMLLLIMSLLGILGMSVMALSTTNFMMNASYIISNSAYYRADGIMEQVSVIIPQIASQLSGRFYGEELIDELIFEIDKAFLQIEQNESNADKKEYADIQYEVYGNQPTTIKVDVSFRIDKIIKIITAEFQLKVDSAEAIDLTPIFSTYLYAAGGDFRTSNASKNATIKIESKDSEVGYIGKSIDDRIEFKKGIINKTPDTDTIGIEDIFDKIENNLSSTPIKGDVYNDVFVYIDTSGATLEVPLDFLYRKKAFIFSSGDIKLICTEPRTIDLSIAMIAKGDIIFDIEGIGNANKNIELNKLHSDLISALIAEYQQISEHFISGEGTVSVIKKGRNEKL